MEIKKVSEGTALTVYLSGRLDAVTALELDKNLSATLGAVTDLTIDLADLEYISSAGLRTLLKLQKRMDKQGSMKIRNIRQNVREVLDMTGFSDFLTIADDKKAKFSVSF
ncbi:MAG: STAS domain-containing protein [Selenomonadaceae bacterium]|nr:STAS domain-containing protein [Selenomonadaceae bacterium]MBQ4494408.1 STAS domain-containing protein [Selenomonadaceae bacterium]MBQ6759183.1 STAS domain-containing protein [Selenomonadaceae bacterium]MBR0103200.1 STAS domain-containing protein [Selenomonadaceae bacterium]MBR6713057.1 STAS domain-containing protein [Selenomonadaceae bacterium]